MKGSGSGEVESLERKSEADPHSDQVCSQISVTARVNKNIPWRSCSE